MKVIKRVLEKVCPCCGGAGYYSETGTETVRGEDGCPEPSPCEVQVQCDCNGIKEAEIKKIMNGEYKSGYHDALNGRPFRKDM